MAWNQRLATILAIIAIALLFGSMMQTNWKKVDDDNNAFAKDCNDRGGVARFDPAARQCIGAKILPQKEVSK